MKGKKAPKKISCKNADSGCNIMMFPKEVEKHSFVCLYQHVECEGCGETMFLKDQVIHQKVKKCIEKKVKSDRICHARRAHSDMMKYNQRMKSLKASIEVMNWQRLKGLVHEKHGWTPRVPNAWGEEFEQLEPPNLPLPLESSTPAILDDIPEGDDTLDGRHIEAKYDIERVGMATEGYTKTPLHSPRVQHEQDENESKDRTQKERVLSAQVTFANQNEYEDTSTIPCSTCEASKRSQSSARAPSLCMRCGKFFRLSSNNNTACQYHEGPILEVHRMCAACGKLDYRPGCCKGAHIPLEISLEERPQTPLHKKVLLRKQGLSPRTASPMFLMKGEKLSA